MPYEKLDDEDIASAISMARQLNAIPPEMRGQSVSSRPTSISEDLGRMAGQAIAAAPEWLRGGSDPNKVESTVSTLSGFMPPMAAEQALTDVERGEYGNAALNAAGLLPLGKLAAPLVTKAMAVMPKAVPQAVEEAVSGIRGYHGSPHDFPAERLVKMPDGSEQFIVGAPNQLPDIPEGAEVLMDLPYGRFRLDKIGTGEGAQAYGHGSYIAEHEPIAINYRDALRRKNDAVTFEGATITDPQEFWSVKDKLELEDWRQAKVFEELSKRSGSMEERIKDMRDWYREQPQMLDAIDALSNRMSIKENPGKIYEVNIRANPEHFLDWDKPFGDQSVAIRNILDPHVNEMVDRINMARKEALKRGRMFTGRPYSAKQLELFNTIAEPNEFTGNVIYNRLQHNLGAVSPNDKAPEASQQLLEMGIPGIRYLDANSRSAGEGTSNYVIFDPSIIDILRKYRQGGYIHKEGGGVAIGNDAINDAIRLARQPYVNSVASPQELAGAQAYGQAVGMQKQYDNPERLTANTDPLGYMPVNARPPEDRNVQVVVPTAKGPTYTTQEDIDRGARRGQLLYNSFVQPVVDAVTLPGDAALSRTAGMTNEEIIPRALNLAGMVTLGAGAVPVEAGSLRAGAGLYSKAERIASELPMEKMQGQQALAMLVKGGVSPEELKWTGLADRLPQQNALTKQQLVDMIRQGDVQLNETVLGALPNKPYDRVEVRPTETASAPFMNDWNKLIEEKNMLQADVNQALAEGRYTDWRHDPIIAAKDKSITDRMDELHQKMVDATIEEMGGLAEPPQSVKYKSYSIPGGENYRETLITLPNDLTNLQSLHSEAYQNSLQAISDYAKAPLGSAEANEALERINKYSDEESRLHDQVAAAKRVTFQSGHWPDDKNVLAHIRTNEFVATNPEGGPSLRAFNLDELQSDWAQKGRSEGFKNPNDYSIAQDARGIWRIRDKNGERYDPNGYAGFSSKEEAQKALEKDWRLPGYPMAPYVQSTNQWTDLGLKKAMSQAIDSGADVFTWTPGNVSAKRYDLSQSISDVHYRGQDLVALDHDGNQVFGTTGVTKEQLPDYIGKEAAEKLLKQEPKNGWRSLEGQELEVGGEGMKDFYNNIVPKRLSEVIRKSTGEKPQFQTWTIQTADGPMEVQGFRITPEMRAKLSEAKQKTGGYFPHFAYGGKVAPNVDTALRLAAEYGD